LEYEAVLYEVDEHIATITLNRPDRMNAFSNQMMAEWEDAIRRSQADPDVRAVIITGAGRAFCAGADLKAREDRDTLLPHEATAADRRDGLRHSVHRVSVALQYLDKPYIAAINGAAVGAGMDMASQADIRIASDKARFGMAFVNVGLVPGDGGSWLMPRLIGIQNALDLIWSGEIFDAQRALDLGYVFRVVPHDDLMTETRAYAQRLAEGPPVAIQMSKRLVYRGLSTSFLEALEAAQTAFALTGATEDAREGPRAFMEKRKPAFKGR
jgi:enoyl-CoA hydratase/carnithine racemase